MLGSPVRGIDVDEAKMGLPNWNVQHYAWPGTIMLDSFTRGTKNRAHCYAEDQYVWLLLGRIFLQLLQVCLAERRGF